MKNKETTIGKNHEAKGHESPRQADVQKEHPPVKDVKTGTMTPAEELPVVVSPAAAAAEPEAETTAHPLPQNEKAVPSSADPIKELQQQVEEFKEKYLRTRADMDNYRKRVQREYQEIRLNEKTAVIQAFLSVFDHFQMAQEHFGKEPDLQTMKEGLDLILNEFKKAFADLGVEQLQALGKPFNPEYHQAVSQEASPEVAMGQVLRQWKCGYRMGEVLLRPAVVVVSSGAPAPAAAPATDNQKPLN